MRAERLTGLGTKCIALNVIPTATINLPMGLSELLMDGLRDQVQRHSRKHTTSL